MTLEPILRVHVSTSCDEIAEKGFMARALAWVLALAALSGSLLRAGYGAGAATEDDGGGC